MKTALVVSTLSVSLGLLLSGAALAVEEDHTLSANPAERCQGALPNFEGSLRKRPLAVQNEGTTNAYLTCSFAIEAGQAIPGSTSVSTWYYNSNAAATEVTCTAVSGYQTGTNEYVSQTVSVPAGTQGQLFWEDLDFVEGLEGLVSVSCNLAPGIGINDTYVNWAEDDSEGV